MNTRDKQEIIRIRDSLAAGLKPVKIYLFGSYADGTYSEESDFDFYIVVRDDESDLANLTAKAYSLIGHERDYPVDILIGRNTRFEKMKHFPTLENEVYRKGVLLYGRPD